jgi:hypothetical protein
MNVGGLGAFAGGLAGGYEDAENSAARRGLLKAQATNVDAEAARTGTQTGIMQAGQDYMHRLADLIHANGAPALASYVGGSGWAPTPPATAKVAPTTPNASMLPTGASSGLTPSY